MVTAAQQTVAVPTTAIVILVSATIFALGFAWAVMRRANADHKAVKAAVKNTRKAFWTTWWTAMKRLVVVAIVGFVLVVWSAREIRHNDQDVDQTVPANLAPSSSAAPRHA